MTASVSPIVALAPMSGISDLPFRRLAFRFGADFVVTEMVASGELARSNREALRRSAHSPDAGALIVQLAGRDPHWMAEGARIAEGLGAVMIDINLGCPAKKVVIGYAGSALMREPDLALALIEATVKATRLPVTLKMRLGWDARSINAPELAARAEAAGVKRITVHGRTRAQFYTGVADWRAVRAVKAAVGVPVLVNGDIVCARTAAEALAQSHADGVLVGRGAYGRPWIVGAIGRALRGEQADPPTLPAIAALMAEHYEEMLGHYGLAQGVRAARKHLGWYAEHFPDGAAFRSAAMAEDDPARVRQLIAGLVRQEAFAEAA